MDDRDKSREQLIDELAALRREVAELKGQEVQRQRTQEQIRFQADLLDAVEQAVIATDLEGTITYWNRFAELLYGWRADEAVGHNILDVTPAESSHMVASEILSYLRAGDRWSGEFLVRRRDGATFLAEVIDSPVCNADGVMVGIIGVSIDITLRKRAEEALRFFAEASKVLASSLDYQTTLASVVRLAVPALADWCSVDVVEEGQTIGWVEIAHTDPAKVELARELRRRFLADPAAPYGVPQVLRTGQPEVYPDIRASLATASALDAEYLAVLDHWNIRSSMIVPLVARKRTLGALMVALAESGRRFGPSDLALAQELASRAALAIENARLYREAQQAIHAREQFLSIASHELKTPLTSLLGYAELLHRRAARERLLPERDQRALRVIAEQASRLNKLILALLDLSRLETGQLSIERAPLDLGALARRLVDEVQPALDQHTLVFRGPSKPLIVEGDELRLEQVIQNLIQNAVKYSPLGGRIIVRAAQRRAQACVSVTDQGIGIPEAALPHLFQRFYRAQNADPRHVSGLGIGLYVVKEIMALHGGAVDVTSREGKGSTFTISLPRVARHRRPTSLMRNA